MRTTFIHTGDFHLGRPFTFQKQGNYYGKNKRKELWQAFDQMIAYAKDEAVPLILVSGDLFDNVDVLIMDIKRVAEGFASLENTQVVIITGNHDYHGEKSPYKKVEWAPNVHVFREDIFRSLYLEELNIEIFGMSWVKNEYRSFPERSFNGIQLDESRYNILMLHGEVTNKSHYLPIDIKMVGKKGFDFVALGHVHKAGITGGDIAYCGSPVPLNFGETGEHGFFITQFEPDAEGKSFTTTCGFYPIHSRKYITTEIQVTPDDSYGDVIRKTIECDTEENRAKNYYRLSLIGSIDPQIQLDWLSDDLDGFFYYVETDISQLETDIDLELLVKENENNPIGQLLESLQQIPQQDIREKAILYTIEAMIGEGVLK